MRTHKIAAIPGDGIGPEVLAAGLSVLEAIEKSEGFQLNTIQGGKGMADGVAQYWRDGQLMIDHHDIIFRTGAHPTMQFNQFIIAPYIGNGSPVKGWHSPPMSSSTPRAGCSGNRTSPAQSGIPFAKR